MDLRRHLLFTVSRMLQHRTTLYTIQNKAILTTFRQFYCNIVIATQSLVVYLHLKNIRIVVYHFANFTFRTVVYHLKNIRTVVSISRIFVLCVASTFLPF